MEQDDLESRGPLPGMHTRYTSQTKYITLSNQNGTISLFKEITYLSKVLRYHGPIIIAKLDSLLIWIWGVLRGVDCLPERGKNNWWGGRAQLTVSEGFTFRSRSNDATESKYSNHYLSTPPPLLHQEMHTPRSVRLSHPQAVCIRKTRRLNISQWCWH